jgi:hypothetical protein
VTPREGRRQGGLRVEEGKEWAGPTRRERGRGRKEGWADGPTKEIGRKRKEKKEKDFPGIKYCG